MSRLIMSVLFLFVFASFLEAAQTDPDLSLYFSFDRIEGGVIPDMSGNGNDGTAPANAQLEEGKFEKALKFGTGSRVELDSKNFEGIPETAVTMGVWVNVQPTGSDQEIFDCIGSGHDSGQYHFEIKSGGAMRWFHRDETETQIFKIETSNVPTGEWVHIAGTYDSETGETVLYINGQEIARATGSGDLSTDWSVGAGLGQHKGGRQLTGLMDEFYMFKRALDADEIVKLMNGDLRPSGVAVQPEGTLAATWGKVKR
jgi:hypothetical protein